jgi:hypothetical protein
MENAKKDFSERTVELIKKWNDPNGGATTEELKELRTTLELTVKDVNQTIAQRENEASDLSGVRFMTLLLLGLRTPDDIDDFVEAWHLRDEDDFQSLHEYLGMTVSEYGRYVENQPNVFETILQERKDSNEHFGRSFIARKSYPFLERGDSQKGNNYPYDIRTGEKIMVTGFDEKSGKYTLHNVAISAQHAWVRVSEEDLLRLQRKN